MVKSHGLLPFKPSWRNRFKISQMYITFPSVKKILLCKRNKKQSSSSSKETIKEKYRGSSKSTNKSYSKWKLLSSKRKSRLRVDGSRDISSNLDTSLFWRIKWAAQSKAKDKKPLMSNMMQSSISFYSKIQDCTTIYSRPEIKVKIGGNKQENTSTKLNRKVDSDL